MTSSTEVLDDAHMKTRTSFWHYTKPRSLLFSWLLLLPLTGHASFIESTIGTAVVSDATATYFNPASLTLLKNPQIITQGSSSVLNTHFKGQFIQAVGTRGQISTVDFKNSQQLRFDPMAL